MLDVIIIIFAIVVTFFATVSLLVTIEITYRDRQYRKRKREK